MSETLIVESPVSIASILETARDAGREHLLEPEGLAVARALGLGVPLHRFVEGSGAAESIDLSLFPGNRLVVKVVSPQILHKSDVGGVAVVPRNHGAVGAAIREMERRFEGWDVAGYTLNELVPHDESLGGQILLGMRWTDDFGPVVTLGPGGIYAELLTANLRPGRDVAILSPALRSPERIAAALDGKAVTSLLTDRLRGQPARMSREALVEILGRLLDFAAASMPHAVSELEFNPVVLTVGGPVAVDALVRLGRLGQGDTPVEAPRPVRKIRNLLKPRSVAVVGVSEKQLNPGRIILQNVLREGFDPARLFVVKPGKDSIDGCRCQPGFSSLPEPVDLAVLAIDAAQVPAAVDEILATRKAESLIVIPGGLGERSGSEGTVERLRVRLAESRSSDWQGPVVNGGNCLGVRSVPGGINTLFIPEAKLRFPQGAAAPLAFLSQSGALTAARASGLAALNPRYLISYGNQLDLTVGDYLAFLKDDPGVEVFACYVEGFRPLDGRRFLEAAAEITAGGRPVILYRAGRTAAGAQATASHTASMAGDYAVTRELAQAAGVLMADTLEDFDDLIRLFCLLRGKSAGLRLGAVSNAGFECVALADHLGCFQLPAFEEETAGRLRGILASRRLDAILDVQNPMDLSPILDDEGYERVVRAILDDEGVEAAVVGCVPMTGALNTLAAGLGTTEDLERNGSIANRLARLFHESSKAWVVAVDGGPLYDPLARYLEDQKVPVFRSIDRAVRALERYCGWRADDVSRR